MLNKKAIFLIVIVSILVSTFTVFARPVLIEDREYRGTDGKWYKCHVYQDDKSGDIYTRVNDGSGNGWDHYNGKKFPNYPPAAPPGGGNGGNPIGEPNYNGNGTPFDISYYATTEFLEISSEEDINVDVTDLYGVVVISNAFVAGTGNYVNIPLPPSIDVTKTYGFIAKYNGNPIWMKIFRFDGYAIDGGD